MTTLSGAENQGTSTRPYLLRALHDWCTDNGFTPYIAAHVGPGVQVPMEYVKNNEIVLNVGFEATSGLQLGNEFVEFKARFGGVSREIRVPIDHVVAIYARENGQGMAFPVPTDGNRAELSTAPTPLRGLRLARSEPAADVAAAEPAPAPAARGLTPAPKPVGGKVATDATSPTGPTDPPPEPAGPAGGRPALKRIK